jgi:hypothetical protein
MWTFWKRYADNSTASHYLPKGPVTTCLKVLMLIGLPARTLKRGTKSTIQQLAGIGRAIVGRDAMASDKRKPSSAVHQR